MWSLAKKARFVLVFTHEGIIISDRARGVTRVALKKKKKKKMETRAGRSARSATATACGAAAARKRAI